MNKTLTDKLFSSVRTALGNVVRSISKFSEDYDVASVPSFFIFMVVVTAGLTVNYFYLSPKVGNLESAAISLMFEVGIFAWKLQGHRVRNSAAQAQVVGWAIWLSTGLAFLMLVSSLTERVSWGWIVATAALVHVVCFLIFDQNDEIRNNRRKNRMAMEGIGQKTINAENAIKEAEADLKIIDKITTELSRLRNQYKHLPNDELEFVLDAYRTRLLNEYHASEAVKNATKGLPDVNKDGRIGSKYPAQALQTPVQPAFAQETENHLDNMKIVSKNPSTGQGQQ